MQYKTKDEIAHWKEVKCGILKARKKRQASFDSLKSDKSKEEIGPIHEFQNNQDEKSLKTVNAILKTLKENLNG